VRDLIPYCPRYLAEKRALRLAQNRLKARAQRRELDRFEVGRRIAVSSWAGWYPFRSPLVWSEWEREFEL
jgi:hypothetical protein